MQQTVAEHENKLDGQQHQLVFKVNLADLARGGEVALWSGEQMVRTYKAYMCVKTGYADNGNDCGVYLHVEDGPFPCRVSRIIEVVHWDGKPESARKIESLYISEAAEGLGRHKFIPLTELTATASPYVKDGGVTFIVTFRFLALQ